MLTQKNITQEHKLRLRWFVALSSLPLLGVVTAFGIMPQSGIDIPGGRVATETVALPAQSRPVGHATTFWRNERIQRGDTFAALLRRLGVDDDDASDYLRKNPAAASFRKLSTGKFVQAEIGADGSLMALRYLNKDASRTVIEKNGDRFVSYTMPGQTETRIFMRSGVITSSLFAAADAAGLPDATASQLADIFGGDIDFHHDLRRGDRFTVIYEMGYGNDLPLHPGRVLAAEFSNRGKTYRAVYFQSGTGHGDYYSPNGKSLQKAFLRSPVAYTRISSGFSLSRYHPFLHVWRAHKGTDFAAPTGTPVKVTADGVVSFVGRERGYGNVIMVRHQRPFSTAYGHLSRFAKGLHRGQHVSQGEIIGYVGMTGWATGPHLHYEFRIHNIQHDPMRVALPDASPVSTAQIPAFKKNTRGLIARLGLLHNTMLAQLD